MSSSTTTGPTVPLDEPSTAGPPLAPHTDPDPTGDELPFESPEFGVGAFFPHLVTPTDD